MLKIRHLVLVLVPLVSILVADATGDSWKASAEEAQAPQSEAEQQSERTQTQKQNTRGFREMASDWMVSIKRSVANYLEQSTKYCTDESADKEHKWLQDFLCGVKITDVVIAIFSILLVLVTVGLVVVGWIQASLLRLTARRQLRAYVFVETAGMYNVTTPPRLGGSPRLQANRSGNHSHHPWSSLPNRNQKFRADSRV